RRLFLLGFLAVCFAYNCFAQSTQKGETHVLPLMKGEVRRGLESPANLQPPSASPLHKGGESGRTETESQSRPQPQTQTRPHRQNQTQPQTQTQPHFHLQVYGP